MESNHTKGEWILGIDGESVFIISNLYNPNHFISIISENGNCNKDAERIVHCVNSHDELVEALKSLYEFNLNGTGYLDQLLNDAEQALKNCNK